MCPYLIWRKAQCRTTRHSKEQTLEASFVRQLFSFIHLLVFGSVASDAWTPRSPPCPPKDGPVGSPHPAAGPVPGGRRTGPAAAAAGRKEWARGFDGSGGPLAPFPTKSVPFWRRQGSCSVGRFNRPTKGRQQQRRGRPQHRVQAAAGLQREEAPRGRRRRQLSSHRCFY